MVSRLCKYVDDSLGWILPGSLERIRDIEMDVHQYGCASEPWGYISRRTSGVIKGTEMVARHCGCAGVSSAWNSLRSSEGTNDMQTFVCLCEPCYVLSYWTVLLSHSCRSYSDRGVPALTFHLCQLLDSWSASFSVWHDPMGQGGVSESWCRVVPLQESTQRSKLLTTQHNSSALVMFWISSGILNLILREKHWHFCDTGHGILFGQAIQLLIPCQTRHTHHVRWICLRPTHHC